MKLPEEIEMIKKFALSDRDNLCTTLKICSSYDQIRDFLIKEFLKILKSFLARELGPFDWKVDDQLSDHLQEPFPRLMMFKPKFGKDYYCVALEPQAKIAKRIFYGIRNGADRVLQPPSYQIYDYLQQKNLGNGSNPNQYWSWGKYLDRDYQNWDEIDILVEFYESIQLNKQQEVVPGAEFGSTVNNIGEPLVEIAKAFDAMMETNETTLAIKGTEGNQRIISQS